MFRISKYSSVKGVSYLSGEHVPVWDYHCHHLVPQANGGTNDFDNLCVLSEAEHQILHSGTPELLYEMYPNKKRKIDSLIKLLRTKHDKYVLNSPKKGFRGAKALSS